MEFTLETFIKASPERLYKAWLDTDEHSDMTGGEALITDDPDDKFTAWDGYIWGKNLELRPHEYIKQSWKTSDFDEDQDYSTIELTFTPENDGTKIVLKHTGLTYKDDHYKKGWFDNYFIPMKSYFEED
jgi:activator of HSP90 ATPase